MEIPRSQLFKASVS